MKCRECAKDGLKSTIEVGCAVTTSAYCPPFYDEEGVYHIHDTNETVTDYECSNGHVWREAQKRRCPAPGCDFNAPQEVALRDPADKA